MTTRKTTTKGRTPRATAGPARKARKKARPAPRRGAAPGNPSARTLIDRADVLRFVDEHAALIAAPDIQKLASEGTRLRARAATLDDPRFATFRAQVDEAVSCIGDYAAGRCDQIPYYTISLLAAALFYFYDPIDAIPDFLPRIGSIDDALVMAVATDRAVDGLRRYRAWKQAGEPARASVPGPKRRRRPQSSRR